MTIKNYIKNSLFTLLFITLFASNLFAEVRAFVDKNRVSIGEVINFTIVLGDENVSLDIVSLKQNFAVMNQGRAVSTKWINGTYSKEVYLKYSIIPKNIGQFVIPAIKIKDKFTKAITITVTKKKSKTVGNKNIFIRDLISNSSPYLNEQFFYTFKIYNRVAVSNLSFNPPTFKNFIAKPIKPDRIYRENVQGLTFNVTELKYLLTPIKRGKIAIEGGVFSFGIVIQEKTRDPFNPFFFSNTRLKRGSLKGQTFNVSVKELPNTNYKNFSNIVGRVSLSVNINKKELKTGESATLSVVVEGRGNLMDFNDIKINLPKTFKVYKDSPEEKINLTDAGYSGKKIFRFAILPLKEGNFKIEPIKLSFFDIAEKKYKLLKSNPINISVKKSNKREKNLQNSDKTNLKVSKKEVKYIEKDILPLKKDISVLEKSQTPLSFKKFILFLLIPMLFFIILKVILLFLKVDLNDKKIMLQKADTALKEAKKDSSNFLTHLSNYILYSLLAIAGKQGENLSYEEIREILSKKQDKESTEKIIALLKKIDSAQYSGTSFKKENRLLISEAQKRVKNFISK